VSTAEENYFKGERCLVYIYSIYIAKRNYKTKLVLCLDGWILNWYRFEELNLYRFKRIRSSKLDYLDKRNR